ncbi:hypothetical protein DWG18_07625 [Lysobacter sp. TY2-98]|uniref:MmcQ/YjbR family DNA-binding protein n=1 Tax=Lysobacter sp. TY2-98 TaxID=2290922 RepID=UPI000E1FFE0B|nr:MmcQ/YjbR family DNA-binding protein [Lysobacter sp. TY2-98]AXK72165.1 hypothetical protein DWG18_07625 [Lysobacter sp. TY2-98]
MSTRASGDRAASKVQSTSRRKRRAFDTQAVRDIALALPEVVEMPHFDFGSFRVNGKLFITLPPGGTHIHAFVDEQERLTALTMYPDGLEPLAWGRRVVGLRVALEEARPEAVEHLIRAAWRNKAPKRLLDRVAPSHTKH